MMFLPVMVTILYASSVGLATKGSMYDQPEFGPAPNVTKVQVDSTAFLHCNVLNLQEDNQVLSIILVLKTFSKLQPTLG